MNIGMPTDPHAPYTLYRHSISYFSGKLEAYLNYKGVPYESINTVLLKEVDFHTGVKKMPALQSADGLWWYDTTPTIEWFEQHYTDSSIIPSDPALHFFALLVEDYGDEWLWRPAMWWRWMPYVSRRAIGAAVAKEAFKTEKLWWVFARRQQQEWLWGDGMTKGNSAAVRDMYFTELEFLQAHLSQQPFLLGSHPTQADYGYFGSMFRHFGNDPDPAEIMRMRAPHVYEWLARLWAVQACDLPAEPHYVWPSQPHWQPLLDRIASDYLPYLLQNARAFAEKQKRFDFVGKNHTFPATKTTHYRVWCLENLQRAYQQLSRPDKERLLSLFAQAEPIANILQATPIASGMDDLFTLPKASRNGKGMKRLSLRSLGFRGQPRN